MFVLCASPTAAVQKCPQATNWVHAACQPERIMYGHTDAFWTRHAIRGMPFISRRPCSIYGCVRSHAFLDSDPSTLKRRSEPAFTFAACVRCMCCGAGPHLCSARSHWLSPGKGVHYWQGKVSRPWTNEKSWKEMTAAEWKVINIYTVWPFFFFFFLSRNTWQMAG